jgi:hypothetical protein
MTEDEKRPEITDTLAIHRHNGTVCGDITIHLKYVPNVRFLELLDIVRSIETALPPSRIIEAVSISGTPWVPDTLSPATSPDNPVPDAKVPEKKERKPSALKGIPKPNPEQRAFLASCGTVEIMLDTYRVRYPGTKLTDDQLRHHWKLRHADTGNSSKRELAMEHPANSSDEELPGKKRDGDKLAVPWKHEFKVGDIVRQALARDNEPVAVGKGRVDQIRPDGNLKVSFTGSTKVLPAGFFKSV